MDISKLRLVKNQSHNLTQMNSSLDRWYEMHADRFIYLDEQDVHDIVQINPVELRIITQMGIIPVINSSYGPLFKLHDLKTIREKNPAEIQNAIRSCFTGVGNDSAGLNFAFLLN